MHKNLLLLLTLLFIHLFTVNVIAAEPGTIDPWVTVTPLPKALRLSPAVVSDGYIFIIGGSSGSCESAVYSAKIHPDGTLGTWTNTTPLPKGLSGHSAVVSDGYIFVTGGWSGSYESAVYSAEIHTDGTLGTWTSTTPLPESFSIHSSVTCNGYIFVLGGSFYDSLKATVYSARVHADGSLGTWGTTTPLPKALVGHSAIVHDRYLIVLGGWSGDFDSSVYSAKINGDGTLEAWTVTTSLPKPLYLYASVSSSQYVYALGGESGHYSYQTAVYSAKLNADGTIGVWNTINPLPMPLYELTAVLSNGYIFVLGGNTINGIQSAVYSAYYHENQAPLAQIQADQSAHIGSLINLDGSGSSDPDGNYPLTYAWEIVSKPEGSTTLLSDPTAVNPSLRVDFLGDYIIRLVVTDSLGLSSMQTQVSINTFNNVPVAEAGDDQYIAVLGSTVQLNGLMSYDLNGDPLTYSWTVRSIPLGSCMKLSDATSATPNFIADVHGDYLVGLTVTDIFGAVSTEDTVKITFANVKPVANAGSNQAVIIGETVHLNGIDSSDANHDPLNYLWNMVSVPDGSTATLSNQTSISTSFIPDLPGNYVISLVVNDGFEDSDPYNVLITVTSYQGELTTMLSVISRTISDFESNVFKNPNMKHALTNKINAALVMIENTEYHNALNKLEDDILEKTNGCVSLGIPDKNDWINDCDHQEILFPLIMNAINLLHNME